MSENSYDNIVGHTCGNLWQNTVIARYLTTRTSLSQMTVLSQRSVICAFEWYRTCPWCASEHWESGPADFEISPNSAAYSESGKVAAILATWSDTGPFSSLSNEISCSHVGRMAAEKMPPPPNGAFDQSAPLSSTESHKLHFLPQYSTDFENSKHSSLPPLSWFHHC